MPIAPKAVRKEFNEGLKLYHNGYGGKGLVQNTIKWARKIVDGDNITDDKIKKMYAFHARHYIDRRANWERNKTPGYVAYKLWGGKSGMKWSKRERGKLIRNNPNSNIINILIGIGIIVSIKLFSRK